MKEGGAGLVLGSVLSPLDSTPGMSMQENEPLPPALLATAVRGRNLAGKTLGAVLGEAPTLLAFLRHFG